MAIYSYLQYYFKAKTKFQVHSPFVFDFVEQVLEDPRRYYYFETIHRFKKQTQETKLSKRTGELLFKIVHHYQPTYGIEIGTGAGVTALYQCTPSQRLQLYTISDKEDRLVKTKEDFKKLGVRNVHLLTGDVFANVTKTLTNLPQLDYIFIKDDCSIDLLKKLLAKCHANTIIVVYQPHEKKRSNIWTTLQQNPKRTISIDLYRLGLVFFRKEQKEPAYYNLIEAYKKPWKFL